MFSSLDCDALSKCSDFYLTTCVNTGRLQLREFRYIGLRQPPQRTSRHAIVGAECITMGEAQKITTGLNFLIDFLRSTLAECLSESLFGYHIIVSVSE